MEQRNYDELLWEFNSIVERWNLYYSLVYRSFIDDTKNTTPDDPVRKFIATLPASTELDNLSDALQVMNSNDCGLLAIALHTVLATRYHYLQKKIFDNGAHVYLGVEVDEDAIPNPTWVYLDAFMPFVKDVAHSHEELLGHEYTQRKNVELQEIVDIEALIARRYATDKFGVEMALGFAKLLEEGW